MSKSIFLLLFLAVANFSICQNATEPLFPVERGGRWGFINRAGKEIIAPKFRNVGRFSEGLAPARLAGTWGFIRPDGNFAIAPKYDFAESFSEGVACVWLEGKPLFVDKKGEIFQMLPEGTREVGSFENGQAEFIAVKNGRPSSFILKKSGEILPNEDVRFSEGLAVVKRQVLDEDGDYNGDEYAVRDSLGNLVVPFGKYLTIENFKNGFAQVAFEVQGFSESSAGFINRKGELVVQLPKGAFVYENYFSEGMVAVQVDATPDDCVRSTFEDFIVWYDTTGRAVLTKKEDRGALPFSCGRAFAQNAEGRDWYLMDKSGAPIGSHRFREVLDSDFSDNLAVVKFTGSQIGMIDSLGEVVVEPQFENIHDLGFQKEGLLVAVEVEDAAEEDKLLWGLIDRQGKWIFEPKLTEIGAAGFQNGLLFAEMGATQGYVNPSGKFVWSTTLEKNPARQEALNIDFMLRAHCYASSSRMEQTLDDSRRNYARPAARAMGFPADSLGVVVNLEEETKFDGIYPAVTAYVFNTTRDTQMIDVQDNRLYLALQALDPKGVWRDIQYSPSSWCGNSYYDIPLKADEFWKFEIPVFDGDFSTSLRLAFTWRRRWVSEEVGREVKTVYSNSFAGKINFGQFWRKLEYSPGGLMDPYND